MKSARVLVFCGDLYHACATARDGVAGLRPEFEFDWVEETRSWDARSLAHYDTVLLTKSNVVAEGNNTPWLVGESCGMFDRFVADGGGLLAVHSGTASYLQVPLVRQVLGGAFTGHPPACEVTLEVGREHAITQGVAPTFTVFDEHYHMQFDDPAAEVFLHSRSEHGVQPAGWTRRHGRGRVGVLTPGHFREVWLHAEFAQLLRGALRWVASGGGER